MTRPRKARPSGSASGRGEGAFRSGWCGLTAREWQHERCLGGHDGGGGTWVPCTCDCHVREVAACLVDVVDVAVLETLVDQLGQLLARPGAAPPAAYRLRAAAIELLAELAPIGGGSP